MTAKTNESEVTAPVSARIGSLVCEVFMDKASDTVSVLKEELTFLEGGGYRSPEVWRGHLIFEESPTCAKGRFSNCGDCVLLEFVPPEHQSEVTPCRFIRIDDSGRTLCDLYRTATHTETDGCVRLWLMRTIRRLEANAEAECRNEHVG